ncbi:MAG: EAL domain-containing protein [Sphingomonas sp.]|jgi:diguanylate cyclase (GGDEF)-like protein
MMAGPFLRRAKTLDAPQIAVPPAMAMPVADLDLGCETIDLLPIAAAIVQAESVGIRLLHGNASFMLAGLADLTTGEEMDPALKSRINAFLESDVPRQDFAWQVGEAVDRRYFRVTVARLQLSAKGRCMLAFVDRTAEQRTEQSLRREMLTDALSGLPNRAGFSELLEQQLLAPGADPANFAVLIVDIDRFSHINACVGSLAGDELLITIARRLKGALRLRDVLARTGGDEFGILLSLDSGRDDANHVARRIERAFSTPFRLADFEIRVCCSLGIAFGSDGVEDSEELIRHAQFAVKRSKSSGTVESYQMQAFDMAREQFSMETALRRAIETNMLRLVYQPIINLASGRIVAFEALARWRSEDGVEHSPANFIPVAEESGLIVPLGRWAMAEAARTLACWDERFGADCKVRFAVNISAIQLQRDHLPAVVERVLADSGLPGSRLVLELTESALISDPDRVTQTLHALKGLGSMLAMDDFGTGYSNLAYLQKLPIDVLKMDRSFVTGMLTDRDKMAIVRAILSLAQALGLNTTAEGIETVELSQALAAMGCTFGQGYHYSRPLEEPAAYSLLCNASA